MKKILLVGGILGIIIISCSKSAPTINNGGGDMVDCTGITPSFAADVSPIIQSSCAANSGCHGTGSSNGPGPLLNYDQISKAKVAIRSAVHTGTMPLVGKLSTTQKNTIICWIDNGSAAN